MKNLDVNFMHPSEQLSVIIGKIYRSGMTTTSGGNLSIKDQNGDIWITPSGVDKGSLTPADIMVIRKNGSIEGKHKPSCEWPFHKAIYEIKPEMTAVIHAHPPGLVAFSIVHEVPQTDLMPLAKRVCGTIGFAPYDVPGSMALGEKIADEFKKHPEYKGVIMENHGVVLCGSDMLDAYQRFETLENFSRIILNAKAIGTPKSLTQDQLSAYEQAAVIPIPSFEGAVYGSEERAIRTEMVSIIRRACVQDLMISTYGSVSVRCKENDFLITPDGKPRWDLFPEEIVQVKGGKAEVGKRPSRSVALHQKIYEQNPHIHSIIMTRTPHLMAFAVSGEKFNVRTIPESWIFLQDVPTFEFGIQYTRTEELAASFSKYPAVLLANDAVVVTGDKLLQTFDKLEVAEFSAKSLIMAAPLGKLKPINDQQVEDLRVAFNVK